MRGIMFILIASIAALFLSALGPVCYGGEEGEDVAGLGGYYEIANVPEGVETAMDVIGALKLGQPIERNETWSGNVYVNHSLHIPHGMTLRVEPGTHIFMAQSVNITCSGQMIIGGGDGLVVEVVGGGAVWGGIGAIDGGTLFVRNATFQNATIPLFAVNATLRGDNVTLHGSSKPQVVGIDAALTLNNATISGGRGVGLGLYASDLYLKYSDINSNTYYGIYALESRMFISSTTIGGNSMGGVLALRCEMVINDANLSRNAGFGLIAVDSGIEMSGVIVHGNTLYGMFLTQGSVVNATDLRVSANAYGGVLLMASHLDAYGLVVARNYGTGIEALDIDIPFEQYVKFVGGGGIDATPTESSGLHTIPQSSPSNVTLDLAVIEFNHRQGIYSLGSNISLARSEIMHNAYTGVFFERVSAATLKGCNMDGNGHQDLYGYGGTAYIENTTIMHGLSMVECTGDIKRTVGIGPTTLTNSYITAENWALSDGTLSLFMGRLNAKYTAMSNVSLSVYGATFVAHTILLNSTVISLGGHGTVVITNCTGTYEYSVSDGSLTVNNKVRVENKGQVGYGGVDAAAIVIAAGLTGLIVLYGIKRPEL